MLAKQPHDVELVIDNSIDKRRVADSVEIVHINSVFNQQLHHCSLAVSAREVEECFATVESIDVVGVSFQDTSDLEEVVSDHRGVEAIGVCFWVALGLSGGFACHV